MIKHWLITGDTHGRTDQRLTNLDTKIYTPDETAVIILGDAGFNFYFGVSDADKFHKRRVDNTGYKVYCVRGNHEDRPENVPGMTTVYDEEVHGYVFRESEHPNINYFLDGGEYTINNHSVLVIGGAYSVDKWYRIGGKSQATWTGWFKDEQLTEDEMDQITEGVAGRTYDFVFTHTCPLDWQPVDLFLRGLDQSTVDNTMECWLNELKNKFTWGVWLFGHFHADRLERPHVEMFYRDIEDMDVIWDRWHGEKELDWWLQKSPNYEASSN